MARYPLAVWKPLAEAYVGRRPMAFYNRVNLHVAVSEAPSLFGYFNAPGRASSHFYVRKDGTVEQYVDTAYRAEADLDGNDATLSVETQGGLHNAQSEPWTDAQVEALAALFVWAVQTHGIKAQIAQDSRIGDSSHGLSWHRLGIDPWRVSGGMHYSTSRGKVCPGDAKIAQVPAVFARAVEILDGAVPVVNPIIPAPAPEQPKPSRPTPKVSVLAIDVDGSWGPATTRALQHVLGTPEDGVISEQYATEITAAIYGAERKRRPRKGGSTAIRALQKVLRVKQDGWIGPQTVKALQRRLGTPADGAISTPDSLMVRALQRRLRAGKV